MVSTLKIQEARAMEAAKAKQEISELKDALVVAEVKARKAGSALEKVGCVERTGNEWPSV
jgi:predicted transcriptional regulator of viral defense system